MKIGWLVSIFVLSISSLQAQASLSGTILDKEQFEQPLMFAEVSLKNTPLSTRTNLSGHFKFDPLSDGEYIVAVSFAGYDTIEVPVRIVSNQSVHIQQSLTAKTLEAGALLTAKREPEEFKTNATASTYQ